MTCKMVIVTEKKPGECQELYVCQAVGISIVDYNSNLSIIGTDYQYHLKLPSLFQK